LRRGLFQFPLPTRAEFALRMLRRAVWFGGVLGFSLGIGAVGYRFTEKMSWVDATLNAAMILTGMGQVDPLRTSGGKIFATIYALFSGIVFLTAMAVILAPVVHRLFHKFHIQLEETSEEDEKGTSTEEGRF
jgi:Ca2+/H+ antiporter